jgi:hypothetical protein
MLMNFSRRKVIVYDSKDRRLEIYCNASENSMKIPLPEKGSDKGQQAGQLYPNPNRFIRVDGFVITVLYRNIAM